MKPLTDELLRRRLADRGAAAPATSLAAIASSVTARPQRRALGATGPWSVARSVAAAVVVGIVLFGGLLGRPAPPSSALGSASASPTLASEAAAASNVSVAPSPTHPTWPPITGCDTLGFDARRCAAIVARATTIAGSPKGIVAVFVGPPDRTGGISLGGGMSIATVDFTLTDGTHNRADIRCGNSFGGVSSDRACSADPQIRLFSGVSHDTPCGPDPCGEGNPGATPPPSPKPAVIAASEPLVLRVFDVPIDHVGHYEVLVGAASLPDGLLSERSGGIGDPRPTGYWIDSGVSIVVRPGKPCTGEACPSIDSIYHASFHGPQPVHVYLVFDVVELTVPGTVLEIRNLVVR